MSTSQPNPTVDGMSAVTISREYGSGGGEIASRLARRLGWTLVDHQIVANVAQRLGMTQEEAQARDERGAGLVARVLDAFLTTAPEGPVQPGDVPSNSADLYHGAVCQVIEEAVRTRHVVIVGRGAQVLLQERRDVFHVRVVAPLELRIEYVSRREGLSESEARTRIHAKEQGRDRYLQTHYGRNPHDPQLYDLTVNTRGITLDGVVELLLMALERKASQLGLPATDLGPGADVARYRARPGDLRPDPA